MASLVAKCERPQIVVETLIAKRWQVDTLEIPQISCHDIVGEASTKDEESESVAIEILDKLLAPSAPGIVQVIDLPETNIEDERNHKNNINSRVLKSLFGSVFIHPICGYDQTFNISSHNKDAQSAVGLANYDTLQLLLPHSGHAFYDNPIHVQ